MEMEVTFMTAQDKALQHKKLKVHKGYANLELSGLLSAVRLSNPPTTPVS